MTDDVNKFLEDAKSETPGRAAPSRSRAPRTAPRKKGKFQSAIDTTRREARKASGTGKYVYHGENKQVTFRLPDEDADWIKAQSAEWNMTQSDLKRWIVRYMRYLVEQEGLRPETESVPTKKKPIMPEL